MRVVLGVKNISDSIDFETNQSADEVRAIINSAQEMFEFKDVNNHYYASVISVLRTYWRHSKARSRLRRPTLRITA